MLLPPTHTRIHTHVYTHTYTHTHVYTHTHAHRHINSHIHTLNMHTHTNKHTHLNTHSRIYRCTQLHRSINMHIQSHIYTHTHLPPAASFWENKSGLGMQACNHLCSTCLSANLTLLHLHSISSTHVEKQAFLKKSWIFCWNVSLLHEFEGSASVFVTVEFSNLMTSYW